jgi:hypothetical protein
MKVPPSSFVLADMTTWCSLRYILIAAALQFVANTLQTFAAFGKDLERQRHVVIAVRLRHAPFSISPSILADDDIDSYC